MKLSTIKRPEAIASLILISFLILDLFLLPKSEKNEILDNGTIETSRTDITASHKSYILLTKEKNSYLVPENIFNTILIDDEFSIKKTFLFRRPAQIYWCKDQYCYIQNIGTFNSHSISYFVLGVIFVLSLLVSLGVLKFKTINNFAILGLSVGVFLFYLIF
jgi:hypothetical protein